MSTPISKVKTEPISINESKRLVELERKIEHGFAMFIEVAEALMEIRDSRLYRVEYKIFEDYCREKWKMSDRRARQLMDASSVVEAIGKSGTIVPKSESQVRPITKLEPEQQPAAWDRAVEIAAGKQPTGKQVEQAVAEVVPNRDDKVEREVLAATRTRRSKSELIRRPYGELQRAWERAIHIQRTWLLKAILREPRYRNWLRKELSKIDEKNTAPGAIGLAGVDAVTHIFDELRENVVLCNRDLMTKWMLEFVTNECGEIDADRARTLLRSCPTYYDSPLTVLLDFYGDNPRRIMEILLGVRGIES